MKKGVKKSIKLHLPWSIISERLLIVVVLIFLSVLLQAQQLNSITVTGLIKDNSGSPVIGASVIEKGTSNGTISNIDGHFSLSVNKNSMLKISYIGYLPQEVAVKGQTKLQIVLSEGTEILDELVVIGYGTVRRSDLTGAVESVRMQELTKAPVKSFDEALGGRVAGVQVTTTDGQPGNLPEIIIRGGNSITQENTPLYVIDGFPIEDNANNTINPEDIESIDILKDASATAIYGARGANGVIIITTKSGKSGSPVINFNTYLGVQQNINKIELLDPYEFVKLQLEINERDATALYLVNQDKQLEDYRNIKSIDWFDKILQNSPMSQNYSLSMSGGTNNNKYLISGSYLNQEGLFINTGFERYQMRVSLDQSIRPQLKMGLNVNYSYSKKYGTVATNNESNYLGASLMSSVWGYRPISVSYNDGIDLENELVDPDVSTTQDYRINPYLQLANEQNEFLSTGLFANLFLDYAITKKLKLRITGGAMLLGNQSNKFNNSFTWTGSPKFPFSYGINGSQTYSNVRNLTNNNTLTYNAVVKKDHKLNIMGGYTQQIRTSDSFGASAMQISNESLGLSGLDDGTPRLITASSSNWALISFLGRINYDYKSKYLFTTTFRTDGSSKFSKENRWGFFPSAAFAYRLSSEKFMKEIDVISNAKLRASYGLTGNNRVDDFAYLATIVTDNTSGYSFGNQTPSKGSYASSLGNASLKWETTNQIDLGIDLGFFEERISINADYYKKTTKDLLLKADLPVLSGYPNAYKNIGSVANSGFEFTLNTVNLKKNKFIWTSNFNISFNRSKVLSLVDNQEALTTSLNAIWGNFFGIPNYIAKVGHPIASFYGTIYEGVYTYDDFVIQANGSYALKDNLPSNGGVRTAIKPGDAKYKDLNNDGLINSNDYTIIGDPNPDFIGGLNNRIEINGFDMSFLFQFSAGNQVLNANRIRFENGYFLSMNTNQYATLANRWTETNQNSNIPRVNGYGGTFYSSRWIEDASFIRLKTLSIGYNFPSNILRSVKIKSLRIYSSAQNLFTFTRYSGLDPEVSTRNSALTPAFDYSPYPITRTIIFGLNLTF